MRARNIKPGFFKNDLLAEVPMAGRMLFIGLWAMADREGRMEDRPKRIKAEVLPYDDVDVDELLTDLHEREFIIRYTVEGNAYIQVVNFDKHQRPHQNEKTSEIPPPQDALHIKEESASHQGDKDLVPREQALRSESCSLNPDTGYLNEEEERAPDGDAPAAEAEDFTEAERYAAECVQAIRGAANVPDADIIGHLRECLNNRGSPVPEHTLRFELQKFRDHWNGKRGNQPINAKWKHWRRALSNWLSRVDVPDEPEPNGFDLYPSWDTFDDQTQPRTPFDRGRASGLRIVSDRP